MPQTKNDGTLRLALWIQTFVNLTACGLWISWLLPLLEPTGSGGFVLSQLTHILGSGLLVFGGALAIAGLVHLRLTLPVIAEIGSCATLGLLLFGLN